MIIFLHMIYIVEYVKLSQTSSTTFHKEIYTEIHEIGKHLHGYRKQHALRCPCLHRQYSAHTPLFHHINLYGTNRKTESRFFYYWSHTDLYSVCAAVLTV